MQGNQYAADWALNPLGSNALHFCAGLVTLTNVYIYGTATGGAIGSGTGQFGVGGIFTSNSYCTLYITVGAPYDATTNSHVMEIFQPTYDDRNGSASIAQNPFDYKPIPSHCAEVTGVFLPYGGTPSYDEIIPSRYEDYVTNLPAPFTVSGSVTNKRENLTWPAVKGSTYTVLSTTNLSVPLSVAVFGVGYFPTNGAYSDTITNSSSKFYKVTTP